MIVISNANGSSTTKEEFNPFAPGYGKFSAFTETSREEDGSDIKNNDSDIFGNGSFDFKIDEAKENNQASTDDEKVKETRDPFDEDDDKDFF